MNGVLSRMPRGLYRRQAQRLLSRRSAGARENGGRGGASAWLLGPASRRLGDSQSSEGARARRGARHVPGCLPGAVAWAFSLRGHGLRPASSAAAVGSSGPGDAVLRWLGGDSGKSLFLGNASFSPPFNINYRDRIYERAGSEYRRGVDALAGPNGHEALADSNGPGALAGPDRHVQRSCCLNPESSLSASSDLHEELKYLIEGPT